MITLVTGGSSMVGKHLQKILPKAIYLTSKDCDLTNYNDTYNLIKKIKPQSVIHLAAKVGGIMDNINKPVDFFEQNIHFTSGVPITPTHGFQKYACCVFFIKDTSCIASSF